MKIVVLSGGGRGDTQPYVALARGFVRAGHSVRLATFREFLPLLEATGVEPIVSEFDPRAMLASEDGRQVMDSGANPLRFLARFSKIVQPLMERSIADLAGYVRGADGLVLSSMSVLTGLGGMERLGVPTVAAFPMPATPTRHLSCVLFPQLPRWLPCHGLYNLLSHRVFFALSRLLMGRYHEAALQRLPDPPRLARTPIPVLYGFSPSVVAPPPDWPAHVSVTGYWFLDGASTYQPPPGLEAFLASGPKPVYVGFGSMNARDPACTAALVDAALDRAGSRAVVASGWGGIAAGSPGRTFAVDAVPHDWLFPRVAAVVHHCGAGTLAAALRAGAPTVGIPHFADQPFWARRAFELGVATRPLPRRRLDSGLLAEALAQAQRGSMRERAAKLGERIRQEDGVGAAVSLALEHFQRG